MEELTNGLDHGEHGAAPRAAIIKPGRKIKKGEMRAAPKHSTSSDNAGNESYRRKALVVLREAQAALEEGARSITKDYAAIRENCIATIRSNRSTIWNGDTPGSSFTDEIESISHDCDRLWNGLYLHSAYTRNIRGDVFDAIIRAMRGNSGHDIENVSADFAKLLELLEEAVLAKATIKPSQPEYIVDAMLRMLPPRALIDEIVSRTIAIAAEIETYHKTTTDDEADGLKQRADHPG